MATIPISLQITTSTDEDNRTDSDTNLSAVDTEDELHTDISTWTLLTERNYSTWLNFMRNTTMFSANLMQQYLHKGPHLLTDSYYTSIFLAQYLITNGTYVIGTIKITGKTFLHSLGELF